MTWLKFAGWSAPDPDDPGLSEAVDRARYTPDRVTRGDLLRLVDAADAYRYLAGRGGTCDGAVSAIRTLRRAVRERRGRE